MSASRLQAKATNILHRNNAQEILQALATLEEHRAEFTTRWLWELVQNARDFPDNSRPMTIRINVSSDRITFAHNGRDFTEEEILSLIYHGSTKQSNSDQLGTFGTGFLSTHLLSKKVRVKGTLSDEENGRRAFEFELDRSGNSADEHKAIIDGALWLRVQGILKVSPRKRAAHSRARTPSLLKGLIFGPSGAAMTPSHTRRNGKLYRYYIDMDVLKRGAAPGPVSRIAAGDVERVVIDQLRAILRTPEIVVRTWRAARRKIDNITEVEVRDALEQLDPLWDELFPAEQDRIVQLLVERVDVREDGVEIRFRVDGLASLVDDFKNDREAA